jgi:hypothetical protein
MKKKKKKQSILNNAKDMPFAPFVIWAWLTFKRGHVWMYHISMPFAPIVIWEWFPFKRGCKELCLVV